MRIAQGEAVVPADLLEKYRDMMTDYGLFPGQIYAPLMDDIPYWEACLKQGRCGPINIPHLAPKGTQGYHDHAWCSPEQFMRDVRNAVSAMKPKGLLPFSVMYDFDEWPAKKYAEAVQYLKPFKQEFPEVKVMMTSGEDPFIANSPIKDLVDIWVIPGRWACSFARAEELKKQGKQIWFYICLGPAFPNWFITSQPSEARALMGIGAYQNRYQGFLYWSADQWYQIDHPITDGPFTNFDMVSMSVPGDGTLLCPGPSGPLATIRLENFRDGLEDYEYYHALEGLVATVEKAPPELIAQAKVALAARWNPYQSSPAAFCAEREKVADLIEKLQIAGK